MTAADRTVTVVPGCVPLDKAQVTCPGCGQTLARIAPGPLPEQHYRRATRRGSGSGWTSQIGTTLRGYRAGRLVAELCPWEDDHLASLIAAIQLGRRSQ
mgnify:CR=1 FL=1